MTSFGMISFYRSVHSWPLSLIACRCPDGWRGFWSSLLLPQGFTPDRLSSSCCHTVPDFHLSSPAKNFFKKAAAALFGGKKDKARYNDTHSKFSDFSSLSVPKITLQFDDWVETLLLAWSHQYICTQMPFDTNSVVNAQPWLTDSLCFLNTDVCCAYNCSWWQGWK